MAVYQLDCWFGACRRFATMQGSLSFSHSSTMNDIILASLRELGGMSTTFGPILVVFLAESCASLQVRTRVTASL